MLDKIVTNIEANTANVETTETTGVRYGDDVAPDYGTI